MTNRTAALRVSLGVAALALILAAVMWPTASSALQQPGAVRITDVERVSKVVPGGVAQFFSLYNRRLTPDSIGNAVLICVPLYGTGPIGPNARRCGGTYTIVHGGTIEVLGLALSPFNYQLAVVGGTGDYANVGGTLAVTFIAGKPLRELLVFTLTVGGK